MTPKDYLKQYYKAKLDIIGKRDKITELRSLAEYASPTAAVKSGGTSDKVGRLSARLADMEARLEREIEGLLKLQEEIEERIDRLEDDRFRLILRERYINCLHWSEVSKAVHIKDRKWLYKLHGRALQQIEVPE